MIDREQVNQVLRQTLDLYRKYYEGVLQLSVDYVTNVSRIVLGDGAAATVTAAPNRPPPQVTPEATTLVLEAEAGTLARGLFLVQNGLDREVTARPQADNCLDPDGSEGAIGIAFVPGEIHLGPGEQMTVQVVAEISDGVPAGVPYRTRFRVPGLADDGIPAVVRRQHGVPSGPTGPAPGKATVKTAKKTSTRTPAKKKRTARKKGARMRKKST